MRIFLNGYRSAVLCDRCPELPQACCTHIPRFRPDDVLWMKEAGMLGDLRKWFALPNFSPGRGYFDILPVQGRRCYFHGAAGCALDISARPAACRIYLCFGARDAANIPDDVFHEVLDSFMRLPRELEAQARHRGIAGPLSWVDGFTVDWTSDEARRLEHLLSSLSSMAGQLPGVPGVHS